MSRRPISGIVAAALGRGLSLASVSVATGLRSEPPPSVVEGFATAMQESGSWSGYVATARTALTSVSANWKVPTVTCRQTSAQQAAAYCVGLDGWFDGTVEQGGTEAYCFGLTAVYSAWWEMFPTNHMTQLFAVRPGDRMSASVLYRNNKPMETFTIDEPATRPPVVHFEKK